MTSTVGRNIAMVEKKALKPPKDLFSIERRRINASKESLMAKELRRKIIFQKISLTILRTRLKK